MCVTKEIFLLWWGCGCNYLPFPKLVLNSAHMYSADGEMVHIVGKSEFLYCVPLCPFVNHANIFTHHIHVYSYSAEMS